MITNEEVKAYLECKRDFVARNCEEKETLQIAIDAVDKQTPKKPIEGEDEFGYFCHLCPNCGSYKIWSVEDWCSECGQHLDWSDDDASET